MPPDNGLDDLAAPTLSADAAADDANADSDADSDADADADGGGGGLSCFLPRSSPWPPPPDVLTDGLTEGPTESAECDRGDPGDRGDRGDRGARRGRRDDGVAEDGSDDDDDDDADDDVGVDADVGAVPVPPPRRADVLVEEWAWDAVGRRWDVCGCAPAVRKDAFRLSDPPKPTFACPSCPCPCPCPCPGESPLTPLPQNRALPRFPPRPRPPDPPSPPLLSPPSAARGVASLGASFGASFGVPLDLSLDLSLGLRRTELTAARTDAGRSPRSIESRSIIPVGASPKTTVSSDEEGRPFPLPAPLPAPWPAPLPAPLPALAFALVVDGDLGVEVRTWRVRSLAARAGERFPPDRTPGVGREDVDDEPPRRPWGEVGGLLPPPVRATGRSPMPPVARSGFGTAFSWGPPLPPLRRALPGRGDVDGVVGDAGDTGTRAAPPLPRREKGGGELIEGFHCRARSRLRNLANWFWQASISFPIVRAAHRRCLLVPLKGRGKSHSSRL